MKILIIFWAILISSVVHAESCSELMRPFLTKNDSITSVIQCSKEATTKQFSTALKTLNYATTVVGYTTSNWNKPKDMEWFVKLGFGLSYSFVCGKIYSQLIHDSNNNRFLYLIKDYIFGRGATVAYTYSNKLFFDPNKKFRVNLEILKKSPTFEADMQNLEKYLNQGTYLDRYKKELSNYLSHFEEINLGLGVHQGIDFDHLTPEDLSNPDIQEVVIAAMINEEYSHHKSIISTGSKNMDFFTYDSLYSVAKIPKDIIVNNIIDKVLCLNMANPARGMTLAIGTYTLSQILFADYYGVTYQVMKKQLINQ